MILFPRLEFQPAVQERKAERLRIHLFWSPGPVLATVAVLRALARVTSWSVSERLPLLLVSALTVFAVSALREARDVARGLSTQWHKYGNILCLLIR
jgi:hypothetical protein